VVPVNGLLRPLRGLAPSGLPLCGSVIALRAMVEPIIRVSGSNPFSAYEKAPSGDGAPS
jgi:hypothetical protein